MDDCNEAISYQRISNGKQRKGTGLKQQDDLADAYCARKGLKLLDVYLDDAVSALHGANGDQGALKVLLDAARNGDFRPGTRLIVQSLDRLSRQRISAAVRLFLDIIDTGLVIVTLIDLDGEQVFTKERVDEDITALIIAVVILSRANNESRAKSKRASEAQQIARTKAREQKIPMPGPYPCWLKRIGKGDTAEYRVIETRKQIVQRVWGLADTGLGEYQIAGLLHELGEPTLTGKGRWTFSRVGYILTNPAVIGLRQLYRYQPKDGKRVRVPDGEPVELFPAVIDKALYRRVKLAREERLSHGRGRKGRAHSNLVSGLGHCVVCKGPLHLAQSQRGFDYLRCVASRERACVNNGGFPYSKLERALLALDVLTDVTVALIPEPVSDDRLTRQIAELEAEVASGRDGMSRMVAAFRGKIGPVAEIAMAEIDVLNGKIQANQDRLEGLRREAQRIELTERKGWLARFKAARAKLHAENIEERKRARAALTMEFRRLIEGVVLHPDRTLTVHLVPDAAGCRSDYALDHKIGLAGIQVMMPDGRTGRIPASVIHGVLRPLAVLPPNADRLTHDALMRQTVDGDEMMSRVRLVTDDGGNVSVSLAESQT